MNWLVMMGRAFAYFFIGEFEEAVSWGKKAIRDPKTIFWANAVYAAALAQLDRNEEARSAIDELLRRKPGFSLTFAKHTYPLSEPAMDKFLTGLAKAGLPE
jgi:adenylate cyclase